MHEHHPLYLTGLLFQLGLYRFHSINSAYLITRMLRSCNATNFSCWWNAPGMAPKTATGVSVVPLTSGGDIEPFHQTNVARTQRVSVIRDISILQGCGDATM
jgi:hypothetical protein